VYASVGPSTVYAIHAAEPQPPPDSSGALQWSELMHSGLPDVEPPSLAKPFAVSGIASAGLFCALELRVNVAEYERACVGVKRMRMKPGIVDVTLVGSGPVKANAAASVPVMVAVAEHERRLAGVEDREGLLGHGADEGAAVELGAEAERVAIDRDLRAGRTSLRQCRRRFLRSCRQRFRRPCRRCCRQKFLRSCLLPRRRGATTVPRPSNR